MAEMEKEGRPPENKRSRKPAHPVKREINEEMKVRVGQAQPQGGEAGNLHGNPSYSMSFAENTMNELLGWYGYDKVELRDSDDIEIRNYPEGEARQHISVLKENSLPKPKGLDDNASSPTIANSSHSAPTPRNGVSEPSGGPSSSCSSSSSSSSSAKEHGNVPIIVPLIPPPLIKPPAEEDLSNVQIMCAWCQKVGVKRYSLSMGSELKSFCSEKCFAACRRAYFKRNKARDEDGHGEKLPQQSYAQDSPRLVFKINSDVLVCDWCKHIRHTKEYLDFGAGERRLQFCSAKCLNQYKMDIFYKETQAALPGGLCGPGHPSMEGKPESGPGGVQLLTPESWNTPLGDLRRKAPSPGGGGGPIPGPSGSSSASPSEPSGPIPGKIPTPGSRPHESPTLPPPMPTLHPPLGVPPGSPPMVMTPRGPVPLPFFMEHQMMQQIRPPFLRAPHHNPGPNSPLPNPMVPGLGPPPLPPRNLGPPSSPMHRPMMSPHLHTSSNPNMSSNPPGLMPPHPGAHLPYNMMPNGHLSMPQMMNFGMPSLAPLVPPPTLLVPYPVIVPLPVPIPIPVPIPFTPKASGDRPDKGDTISNPSSGDGEGESKDPGLFSFRGGGGGGGREGGDSKQGPPKSNELYPGFSGHLFSRSPPERDRRRVVDLKAESFPLPLLSPPAAPQDGVIDLTLGRRSRLQQVIQRAVPSVQVKAEPELHSVLNLAYPGEGAEGGVAPGRGEEHRDTEEKEGGPLDPVALSLSLPCGTDLPAYHPATPPTPALQPAPSPHTLAPALGPDPTHCSTPCNVIVNGTRSPDGPARNGEQRLDPARRSAVSASVTPAAATHEEPAISELESVKENNCSGMELDTGKKALSEEAGAGGDKQDASPADEDHAYALPLLPKAGCVIQPVPKPADKTAIGPLVPQLAGGPGATDLQPPLKRRCLRIRNQNK